MPSLLTTKQERFCLEYFTTGNAYQSAITAGYSQKTAVSIASINLRKPRVLQRIKEFRDAAASDKIADVKERKEKLTEILRDGHKTPLTAKEKVWAISELNKMGGDYAPERHAVLEDILIQVVYVDREKQKETP